MRKSFSRRMSALGLIFLISCWMQACSGQQQDDEQLEVTQQGDQGNQYASEEGEQEYAQGQQGYNQEGGNEYANEEGGNEYANQEGGEYAQAGETENDLQEIIEQMNGQEGNAMADAGGDALAQDPMYGDQMDAAPMEAMDDGTGNMDPGMASASGMVPQTSATTAPFQPGGSPAGPAIPELGSKMPYIVQKGDTMARISARIYGSTSRWQEMASLSGLANPSRIYPGDLVYYTLDDQSVAFATAYENVAKSEEQVQPGDTLASISARVYGSSTNWKSIWRQNETIQNPDVIPPGSTVYYISQSALTAEVNKVKAQLSKIAEIKNRAQRVNGVVMNVNANTTTIQAASLTNNANA